MFVSSKELSLVSELQAEWFAPYGKGGKAAGHCVILSILWWDGAGLPPLSAPWVSPLPYEPALHLAAHALSHSSSPDFPFIFHSLLYCFFLGVTVASHSISSRFICQMGEALAFSLSGHPPSPGRAPSLALGRVSSPGHVPGREVHTGGVCWPKAQPRCHQPNLRLCSKPQ